MITRHTVTTLTLQGVSVVDLLTRSFLPLNADPADTSRPYGISIPVPAGSNGLTVAYFTRKLVGDYEGYYPIIDGQDGIAGAVGSQQTGGIFSGYVWVNGAAFGAGPRYLYSYRKFVPVAVRTPTGQVYADGALFFNMPAGGGVPRANLLTGVDVAYLVVYYRRLTDAELAAPVLPADVDQVYVFSGYQPGDTIVPELRGTGLDATLYY